MRKNAKRLKKIAPKASFQKIHSILISIDHQYKHTDFVLLFSKKQGEKLIDFFKHRIYISVVS